MSCLFNSIGALLNVDPTSLRQDVCNYLASNPQCFDDQTRLNDILKWESNISPEDYVENMRSTSTWGGSNEIRAICDMIQVPVFVHNIRDRPPTVIQFYPLRRQPQRNGLHISWSGGHYEPIGKGSISKYYASG